MKRKEKKQEWHRDAKKREEKRRPNSRADAAGSAPRAKRRRFLEAPGENYPPLLLDGRACYITCQNVEDEASLDEAKWIDKTY